MIEAITNKIIDIENKYRCKVLIEYKVNQAVIRIVDRDFLGESLRDVLPCYIVPYDDEVIEKTLIKLDKLLNDSIKKFYPWGWF